MVQLLPWMLAAALLVAWLALWLLRRQARRHRRSQALPSSWALSARPVFSRDERKLYRQLREALPQHLILAKLPLVRLCQPIDPGRVRYWYELLGATHVSFAICSAHGRVLAAIDLEGDHRSSTRTRQIKRSVLAACKVRYMHCRIEHLPSVPELRALVPDEPPAGLPPLSKIREVAPEWKPTRAFSGAEPDDGAGHDSLIPIGAIVVDDLPPLRH